MFLAFTGISGINLLNLARQGIKVSLEDQFGTPRKIRELWQELRLLDIKYNPDYVQLDYPEKHFFDLGFNFFRFMVHPKHKKFSF